MSSGPIGILCRDLVGGSVTIKGKKVFDEKAHLKTENAKINKSLVIRDDLEISGNITVKGLSKGGVAPPVIIDGNSYVVDITDSTLLIPNMNCFGEAPPCTQIGGDIDGFTPGDQLGFGVALSADGYTLATGSDNAVVDQPVRVFDYNGFSTWVQRGVVPISSLLSRTVSLSDDGNTLVIGSLTNTGVVSVYDWSGSAWVQRGSNLVGNPNDSLGWFVSVSSDGNRFAAGATGNNLVRVYEWNGSAWVQLGTDITGTGQFGWYVGLSGDGNTVVIGAPTDGNGTVDVYRWNGSAWLQLGSTLTGAGSNYGFGRSVSIDTNGDTIAVGAELGGANNEGEVRVYDWSGSVWNQRGATISGDLDAENIGWSVSLSGDGNRVVIGQVYSSLTPTVTKIYAWNESVWEKFCTDFPGEAIGDWNSYGVSISRNGQRLASGAPYNNSDTGHVRVYNLETFPPCPGGGTIYLTLPDAGDCVGKKLKISSDRNDVVSTNNDVIVLFNNFAPQNTIMGNTECFTVLQSTGTDWMKIYNSYCLLF